MLALGWILVALFIALLIPVKVLLGKAHELQDTVTRIIEQQEQLPGLALGWLAGTVVMVGLYFAGEASVPAVWGGLPQALTEWPFNALQNVAGGIVGIPLVLAVRRPYPLSLRWAPGGNDNPKPNIQCPISNIQHPISKG